MDKDEIIARLTEIARHAVHTVGESPFVMSLDDGIALHEAIEMIKNTGCWMPVTPETLPRHNSVVVVCGEKGTWDYGTYRGHYNDINRWHWKKNTIKDVHWWMYKEDALPIPYEEDGQE